MNFDAIHEKHIDTTRKMLEQIKQLPTSKEWRRIFAAFTLARCYRHLSQSAMVQMEDIAVVDSEAVKSLAVMDKKAGLGLLWDLSLRIEQEELRARAVALILQHGVKGARNMIDALIAEAERQPGLFDTDAALSEKQRH